jgi:hypothetical protein
MTRRFWIVCLMLALLPLRGIAADWVQTAQASHTVVHASQTPPCHQLDAKAPASSCCSLCDLCHGATLLTPELLLGASPLPDAAPAPLLVHDTGRRLVGGLDRPPRQLNS